MKTLLILSVALLTGCDAGRISAFHDGTCKGSVTSNDLNSKVSLTRKQEGTHVTCSIEFEVTK